MTILPLLGCPHLCIHRLQQMPGRQFPKGVVVHQFDENLLVARHALHKERFQLFPGTTKGQVLNIESFGKWNNSKFKICPQHLQQAFR
jgi:hypothetical protein